MELDPLAPDAPLIALLSVRTNPMLAEANEDQLVALVRKLRQHATSPQTLAAADADAGKKVATSRQPSASSAAKKAVYDSI